MQLNKDTEFVMYVDNFLEEKNLKHMQETFSNLNYGIAKDMHGNVYGKRHTFYMRKKPDAYVGKKILNDPILKQIKDMFYPNRNLETVSIHAHIKDVTREPLFHMDADDGVCAIFLLFVKGEPLLNNGTGFLYDQQLSSHIGFVENRALFFNCSKILHSDLQALGESSPRYTLNIFFREPDK